MSARRHRARGRGAFALALALAVALGTAGCGISSQDRADRIDRKTVPFGLLDEGTTTTKPADAGRKATVFLLSKDRLVPVERTVPTDAELADLLEQVVSGPTRQERSLGITSAVTPGTIGSVSARRGIAEVDLTSSFGDVRPADQLFALAQIVYTLTGQPGIGAVQFSVEGERVSVPLADGTQTDGPLARDDLASVAPA
ncbi:MAG: GerMN domain-containing protein [Acidimicrobiales bacterium]